MALQHREISCNSNFYLNNGGQVASSGSFSLNYFSVISHFLLIFLLISWVFLIFHLFSRLAISQLFSQLFLSYISHFSVAFSVISLLFTGYWYRRLVIDAARVCIRQCPWLLQTVNFPWMKMNWYSFIFRKDIHTIT